MKRPVWIAVAAVALAAAAVLFLWRREAAREGEAVTEQTEPAGDADSQATADGVAAELYFPGRGGRLYPERREVPAGDRAETRIAGLVEALISGPRDGDLEPPLPRSVAVGAVYLMDGEVVLGLESPERRPPASGSQREMLAVYSLVNTVLLNVEGAERLVLLWNGRQPMTFAGHLDTARPLVANRALIAREPAADPS